MLGGSCEGQQVAEIDPKTKYIFFVKRPCSSLCGPVPLIRCLYPPLFAVLAYSFTTDKGSVSAR